jgi:hypothetical protein
MFWGQQFVVAFSSESNEIPYTSLGECKSFRISALCMYMCPNPEPPGPLSAHAEHPPGKEREKKNGRSSVVRA